MRSRSFSMRVLPSLMLLVLTAPVGWSQTTIAEKESSYYEISSVPIPEDIALEVGGMAFDHQGKLTVCTRRGEVWTIDRPQSTRPVFTRFAHGLHEPLGLAYKDGAYFLSQRGELTKLIDTNQDGRADRYESIYRWDLEGNYHEYSYGPFFLPDGNMLVTLNLGWIGRGASLSKWRGWMLEITPEGEMTPIATGMRSPAGFGANAAGDIFYTENQGDWVGSGRMTHVEKGDFVGNPEGLKWTGEPGSPLTLQMEDIQDSLGLTLYEYAKRREEVKPPSVWFPHTLMGISTSDLKVIPEGFGPFAGQLLVGDQGHSKIMRVFQEKVNGVYQGVCFPFKEGFSSGVLRLTWAPDQSLYVGMTSRGWSSTGREPYGLERLTWKGKTPFEIKTIKAQSDGFLLEFTQPVNKAKAADPQSYSITDFTYKYHHIYGSPPVDQEDRVIQQVVVAGDGLTARLKVDHLRPGYVYEIKADGVTNRQGSGLLHTFGYYTLNQIPEGGPVSSEAAATEPAATVTTASDSAQPKRMAQVPSSWTDGPEVTITITSVPGLKFDKEEIRVKAGSKVKWEFNNPDDMIHNLVIVQPGAADEVGNQAMNLGLKGHEMNYVPESEQVLFHTKLLEPQSKDIIYFEAPSEPGTYQYVCTFPGHHFTMRGVLIVE